jgi:hypothetical protein
VKLARLPFSYLLPLTELTIWLVLVIVPATLFFFQLRSLAGPTGAPIQTATYKAFIPRHEIFSFAFTTGASRHSHIITALNLPGIIVEVLISLPTRSSVSWVPAGFFLDSWRSLVLPFFCLPAWWFVGRGIDALLGRRHLHWATLLTGSALSLLSSVLFLGLRFGASASERSENGGIGWILWGFGFWALAFAVFPTAWLRQRKSLNPTPSNSEPPTPAEPPPTPPHQNRNTA